MKTLCLTGDPITVRGVFDVEQTDQGLLFWRLPASQQNFFAEALLDKAQTTSGVRLTWRSDTSRVAIEGQLQTDPIEIDAKFDLLIDGQLHQRRQAESKPVSIVFDNLPKGEHLLELYLPQTPVWFLNSLAVDDDATVLPDDRKQLRWITYGSSITHCRRAAGPSETWPALVARQFDLDLLNMGFGGQCHIDGMIARAIRDQPADVISLCLGINVYGQGSLNPRTFREAAISFVATIRDSHPQTPLAVMSPIFGFQRETTLNPAGLNLPMMREMLEQTVNILRKHGDEKIIFINGLDIFNKTDGHLMPDQLHPGAEGDVLMGQRFGEKVMPKLLEMR